LDQSLFILGVTIIKSNAGRQIGDWDEVLRLAREVKKGYRADDFIEWMPFLQAYVERRWAATKQLSSVMRKQICNKPARIL
jgi:hypothetical protein